MMNMNLSLTKRIIGITVGAFIVITGFITTHNYHSIYHELYSSKKDIVTSISNSLKVTIITSMLTGRCKDVQKIVTAMAKENNIEEVEIINPEGNLIMISSNPSHMGKKLTEEAYGAYLEHHNSEPFTSGDDPSSMVRYVQINNEPSCYPCHGQQANTLGVLKVKYALGKMHLFMRNVISDTVVFSILAAILFVLVFYYIIIKLINEPLGEITEAIRFIERGNYDQRVPIKRYDIIGQLAEKFNSMVAKIQETERSIKNLHKEQMKRASQLAMIGEVASGIAHEVKNPLACIGSALHVIKNDPKGCEGYKEIITEMINQINRLDSTVKRILEFAKPIKSQKAEISVDEVLNETVVFVNEFAKKSDIEITISGEAGGKNVYADGKALRQLFLNIYLNGIEAMEGRGILHICSKMAVKERLDEKKAYVEVSVQDSGKGIPREQMVSIFDPFFTTKAKGTGLGLSISNQIVEEHNGFIEVESVPGQGTTFKIYLPTVQES